MLGTKHEIKAACPFIETTLPFLTLFLCTTVNTNINYILLPAIIAEDEVNNTVGNTQQVFLARFARRYQNHDSGSLAAK